MSMSHGLTTIGSQAKSVASRPAPGVSFFVSARAASRPRECTGGAGFGRAFSGGASAARAVRAEEANAARRRRILGFIKSVGNEESRGTIETQWRGQPSVENRTETALTPAQRIIVPRGFARGPRRGRNLRLSFAFLGWCRRRNASNAKPTVLVFPLSPGERAGVRAGQIHISENAVGFQSPLRHFFSFGSRFSFICSGVTADSTPIIGTSALVIQSRALRTTLRWLSLAQLAWVWPPVKPKPRPPSGRSK